MKSISMCIQVAISVVTYLLTLFKVPENFIHICNLFSIIHAQCTVVKLITGAQLVKGGQFAQKFSKYFFHFTLGQKISKVIVLSWFTFFKGKEVFLNFQFFLSMYSKTQKTKKMRLYQPHLFGFLCFWVHTQEKLKIEKNWS